MLYKVVTTIEKGESVLTSVPESWEKDGILFWPKKKAIDKIKQGVNPEDDWDHINCIVKRRNMSTFEDAEKEIDRMCERSDTECIETADEMPVKKRLKKKKTAISTFSIQPDFNDQAQACLKNSSQINSEKRLTTSQKKDEATSSTITPSALKVLDKSSPEITSTPMEIPMNMATMDLPSTSNVTQTGTLTEELNTSHNHNDEFIFLPQTDEPPTGVLQGLSVNLDALQTVLNSVLDNQRILSENQQKITSELVKLNVRLEEFIKQFLSRDNEKVDGKPNFTAIAKIEDLEELENKLKDRKYKAELEKIFSVVCRQNGKGLNTAYKLVDLIFSRDFMKQCSWAGGSRVEGKKICFKAFQRTIDVFFNMVKSTDNSFTLEECETFFKNILRNSKKRSLLTNTRQSAAKRRSKNITKKKNNNEGPEKSQENALIHEAVDHEEEESLC